MRDGEALTLEQCAEEIRELTAENAVFNRDIEKLRKAFRGLQAERNKAHKDIDRLMDVNAKLSALDKGAEINREEPETDWRSNRAFSLRLMPNGFPKAIDDICKERTDQVLKHGYTPEHDDEHRLMELSRVARVFVRSTYSGGKPFLIDQYLPNWPFKDSEGFLLLAKVLCKPSRERLVIAAALLVAEIERMDRSEGGEA